MWTCARDIDRWLNKQNAGPRVRLTEGPALRVRQLV
jgi:hypothetical protein